MAYEIKNVVQNEEILTVTVEYTFDDNSVKTIDVPIFRPTSKQDVITGIENRYASEVVKLEAEKKAKEILDEVTKDIGE